MHHSPPGGRLLTKAEFHRLTDVPPEFEWFAKMTNPQIRHTYEAVVNDFVRFTGIARPDEFLGDAHPRHRCHP
jgi:hypothetical protein